MYFFFRPYASESQVNTGPQTYRTLSMNSFIGVPLRLPSLVDINDYHDITITVLQLLKVYTYLYTMDREKNTYFLPVPALFPQMQNFSKYNKEPVNLEQLKAVFQYMYKVIHDRPAEERPPAPQPLGPEIELKIQEFERRRKNIQSTVEALLAQTVTASPAAVTQTSMERATHAAKSGRY